MARLQMQTYAIITNFEYALDKYGREYGWGLARYGTPERRFGADWLEKAYREDPTASRDRVYARLGELCPGAGEKLLRRLLGD